MDLQERRVFTLAIIFIFSQRRDNVIYFNYIIYFKERILFYSMLRKENNKNIEITQMHLKVELKKIYFESKKNRPYS